MQVVFRGNDEYDRLIKQRYSTLDDLNSKEPLTNKSRLDFKTNLTQLMKELVKLIIRIRF